MSLLPLGIVQENLCHSRHNAYPDSDKAPRFVPFDKNPVLKCHLGFMCAWFCLWVYVYVCVWWENAIAGVLENGVSDRQGSFSVVIVLWDVSNQY